MPTRNIIVIGASAGGFEPLKTIAAGLPPDFEASVFIVWHMSPDVRGILPQVLSRAGPLQASQAYDGQPIEPGRIYVAAPDHHLLLQNGAVRVTRGPKENRFRPAVDPLFRSAAAEYGRQVIGVVLSGALDDGTAGLWTVKQHGGLAIVQHPMDAEVPSMPENALRDVPVDFAVSASEIPALLLRLCGEELPDALPVAEDDKTRLEIRIAAEDSANENGLMNFGELTPYTCPECHGVLTALRDGNIKRFRCHTGHAFSADTLLASVTAGIEDSLWNAIRNIQEGVMLLNHMGDHFAEVNQPKLAALYFRKANEAEQRADMVRKVVLSHQQLSKESLMDAAGEEGSA